jgi:hypothetical protein
VRPHDDEIGLNRRGRPQNAVKGIAGNDRWAALRVTQFRHCTDLLSKDPLGLTLLNRDQVLRLIIVHDVNESEFGAPGLRQQACSPQRPV